MIRGRVSSFAEVEKEINRLVALVPDAVANEAAQIIRDNSAEGKDIQGRKFLPYSKEYKKFRAKHGLSTEPPNLRRTGHLLDLQKVESQGMKSSVRPSAVDEQIAQGLIYKYPFYPENDSDILPSFNDRLSKAGEKAITNGSK